MNEPSLTASPTTTPPVPATANPTGGEHDAAAGPPVDHYPESHRPHPLAITSVVAGICGVVGLPLLGSFTVHGWWVSVPTVASLIAVVSGHLAIRRLALTERGDRRLAAGGLAAGYLGLTLLVAETVLLVGVLSLAASVIGRTGG